jgi:hypothetical protein
MYAAGKSESPDGVSLPGPTRTHVKELLNVSEGSMHRAKVVERQGTPSLVSITSEGKVPLASAARVAEAPAETQEEFVAAVRAGEDATKASLKTAAKVVETPRRRPTGTRDGRADLIRELAEQGYTSRQMAEPVGVLEERVREIARSYDIDIPGDRSTRHTKRPESTRIAGTTVTALEGLAMGVELIDYDALERDPGWADSLTQSMKVLNTFVSKIKETSR